MNRIEELIQELCPEGVEFVKIKDVFTRLKGTPITATKMKEIANNNGNIRIFAGGKTIIDAYETEIPNANIIRNPAVLIQSRGVIDAIFYEKPFTFKNEMWAYTCNNIIQLKYLYYILKNNMEYFKGMASRAGSLPQISLGITEDFEIPLPPLPIQSVIVSILDKFTTLEVELEARLEMEKNCRLQQYKYYREKLLSFENDNNVEWKNLNSLCKIMNGKDYKHLEEGNIPVYGSGGIMTYVDTAAYDGISILLPRKGSIGNIFYVDEPFWTVDTVYWTQINEEVINPKFLYHYLKTINIKSMNQAVGAVPSMTQTQYYKINVPLPLLEEQSRIANILDRFEALTTSISEGLPAEIAARKQQYEYYRNKLLTFNRKAV